MQSLDPLSMRTTTPEHHYDNTSYRSNKVLEDPEKPVPKALEHLWCLVVWVQRTPPLVPLLNSRAPEVQYCGSPLAERAQLL